MTCRDIDECRNCPIKDECDEVDEFCEETYDSDITFDHELLAKIYTKGKADGIAEANLAHNTECGDCVRQIATMDEARIRAEAIDEFVESISESVLWDILAEVMKRNIGASEGADKVFDYLREIAEKLKLKEQKND